MYKYPFSWDVKTYGNTKKHFLFLEFYMVSKSWKFASSVLCDKNVSSKLKAKFYRVMVRPTLLYEIECWPIKNSHLSKMKVAEVRKLRWMCGHARRDKLRNEDIRGKVGLDLVVHKMWETILR